MDLFEYQGKQYFARYGIPVSPGGLAVTPDEAVELAEQVGYPVVLKAQVQVGGRGKRAGSSWRPTPTKPTPTPGPSSGWTSGATSSAGLWVEHASDIAREYYASFTLDRGAKAHLAMVSAKGGVEIEQVADEDPGAIARLHVDPFYGFDEGMARRLVEEAGIDDEAKAGTVEVLGLLYRCFVDGDADLVEVNPLILTTDGRVHALDAKVTLDDNAAFRHPEWEEFAGTAELDERERRAHDFGLQYVGLDGFVGIIANGAGLAMSTCDVVNQVGGQPANFLDIGGRGQRRGHGQRIRSDQFRPERALYFRQYLRWHHPGGRGGQRYRHRRSGGSISRSPWSSA